MWLRGRPCTEEVPRVPGKVPVGTQGREGRGVHFPDRVRTSKYHVPRYNGGHDMVGTYLVAGPF